MKRRQKNHWIPTCHVTFAMVARRQRLCVSCFIESHLYAVSRPDPSSASSPSLRLKKQNLTLSKSAGWKTSQQKTTTFDGKFQ
ncbi:hypothetical protein Bpfe_022632, partial [Biomphalaria pfeifferi]